MPDPNPAVTHSFSPNTTAESGQVNTNYNDLVTWLNTYAIRRDGTVSFTQPVSGSTPTSAAHLVTKAYADNGPPAFSLVEYSPPDDTVTATGAWQQWGTAGDHTTTADPGRQVDIWAVLTGTVSTGTASAHECFVRVAVSVDGGSTYAYTSDEYPVTVHDTYAEKLSVAAQDLVSGVTPTGAIWVKAEIRQNTGTAGNVDFVNARLVVLVKPS